jgi:hypothetical protein
MRALLVLFIIGGVGCDADEVHQTVSDQGVDARRDADVPDMPVEVRIAVGAACVAGQVPCERGACVHGICSVICSQSSDCPDDLVCVGRGGAGRCTPRCNRDEPCADGQVCAVTGPQAGFCVAPGEGAGGDPCTSREDCASWVCAQGECAAACEADGCAADQRCLALHTQDVCVPVGAGEDEAPCAAGSQCLSGICRGGRCSTACADGACPHDRVCIAYDTLNLCERRCADSEDCGETGICQPGAAGQICAVRGVQAEGSPCEDAAQCASGRCQSGQCAARCDDGVCPPGRACVTDISGSVCRLAGAVELGGACARGADCLSGFCAGGRCALDCADGTCPAGTRCTRFAEGSFCFSACAEDADCPDAARCDTRFAEGPTCFWRGDVADGETCTADAQCASGRCHAGRCLVRCPTGDCAIGTLCVDFDTVDLCAPTPLPEGAACGPGDVCAEGYACTGGRCLPGCAMGCPTAAVCVGAECRPRCDADTDCGPGLLCNRFDGSAPYCDLRGEVDPGGMCARAADCASGLCFNGLCRAGCDAGCPEGEGCITLAGGAWCLPVGEGVVGDPCVRDGACRSGLCVGRRCATPCPELGCPDGTRCRTLRAGGFCVADCDPVAAEGCGLDELCAPYPADAGGLCVPADERAAVGEPCADASACTAAAIACLPSLDGMRCRAPCRSDDDCPNEQVCASMQAGAAYGACMPRGAGGDLAPCSTHGDCASAWCVQGRCVRECARDSDCGDARLCVDLARDPQVPFRACAPPCAAECADELACRMRLDGASACY